MKRSPLRRVSPKRAAANREYAKVREIYLRENPNCCYCDYAATEIHHLCSGGSRAVSLVNSDTWLALCAACHEFVQHQPKEFQVRMKLRRVLKTINKLRGRAENAITLEELL